VNNITAAPLFKSNPQTGFGTFNPDSTANFSVTDGAFGQTIRAYPTPHLVGRNFRPQPFLTQLLPFPFSDPTKLATAAFTPSEIEFITTHFTGNYTDFQAYMDGVTSENGRAEGMHNAAHLMMEG
jgi:tyrosinase